jgi:4-hydroxybenzoate polyprenyltransferase
MRTLSALVRATHPLPALAVTVLVGVVTSARGAGAGTLAWVVLSTAAGQASVGWSNDVLDLGRDRTAGRLEKPLVADEIGASTVWRLAVVAFPLSVVLSVPLGVPEAVVMLVAVGSAWAYNAGLKTTLLSWLPYAVSFGLAPVYIWLATSRALPPAWLVGAAGLLGAAAHLLNVLPDFEADRVQSTTGVVHRLGFRRSLLLACTVLAALLGVVLLADGVPATRGQLLAAAAGGASIAAVAAAVLRGAPRLGFRVAIVAAAAIVATFVLSPAAQRL